MRHNEEHSGGLIETIARLWCRLTHNAPMWPINGEYECRICMRRFRVAWAETPGKAVSTTQPIPVLTRRLIPVYPPSTFTSESVRGVVRAGPAGAVSATSITGALEQGVRKHIVVSARSVLTMAAVVPRGDGT